MAKSADAADLKSADRKVMGVQVPLRAPNTQKLSGNAARSLVATAIQPFNSNSDFV